MATRLSSQSPRVSFRDELKAGIERQERDKGRMSTQESEEENIRVRGRRGSKSGAQGEFSGNFDREGHHLKSDGTPDMRFKENREEFEGEGFEHSNQGVQPIQVKSRTGSVIRGKSSLTRRAKEEKPEGKREPKEARREEKEPRREGRESKQGKTRTISTRRKVVTIPQGRELRPKSKFSKISEHQKSDGTPDMRFKENRDQYSGEGLEGTTSRSSYRMSKANVGMYEGNVPGEHSGKYDREGHHLKNDGTPDMRFKENREEYSGQGFESQTKGKTARYTLEHDDAFDKPIYYRRRRPPTPYALYIREKAPEMKREHEDMDMNEVFRELGQNWRELSDKEKQKYYDMYEDEVNRYEELNAQTHGHRGPLSFRKMAQKRGFKIELGYSSNKRGKTSGGRRRMDRETNVEDDEEDYENYNPDEENMNPNQGITA